MRVLVTGANGFVGQSVLKLLPGDGHDVVAAVRRAPANRMAGIEYVIIGDINATTDWRCALRGCDAIIHLAATTHLTERDDASTQAAYDRVNVDGTRGLLTAAVREGVTRIVYASSIKVNGERTADPGSRQGVLPASFTPADEPRPEGPYGSSKLRAENLLLGAAETLVGEVVILRPPLVFGPGQKANMLQLMHWVARGVPLPFAAVNNRRSLIHVDSLAQALITVTSSREVTNGVFTVADGSLSTPQLIETIATALGREARLWPCPSGVLRFAASLGGQRQRIGKLLDSLRVDSSRFERCYDWQPRSDFAAGFVEAAQWYLAQQNSQA